MPRNDYEIVVPEEEMDSTDNRPSDKLSVEDQADIDARAVAALAAQSMY